MGIGPVPAVKAALTKAGKSLQDMQLIEVLIILLLNVMCVILVVNCNSFIHLELHLQQMLNVRFAFLFS